MTKSQKEMSRLITASIVGAMDWVDECPRSWQKRAIDSATLQLSRIYPEPRPEPMEKGIKLENAVYAHVLQHSTAGSEHFKWLVEQSTGGVFQKKTKRFIDIDGVEYCLYGKIDVWFPDIIKDIKSTSAYGGKHKYLKSIQHKLYCYTERISKFQYIIGEFAEGTSKLIGHYSVLYEVTDWEVLRQELIERIKRFIDSLKRNENLFELYTSTFSRY